MQVKLPAPANLWWYEMHIAGMVGQTIEVDGKPYKVVSAHHEGDDDGMNRATAMLLGLIANDQA